MYSIKNVKASNHPYRPLYALSKFLGVQGSFVFWCGFFFFRVHITSDISGIEGHYCSYLSSDVVSVG